MQQDCERERRLVAEEALCQRQVPIAGDGKELGDALDDAQDDGLEEGRTKVHASAPTTVLRADGLSSEVPRRGRTGQASTKRH